MKLAGRLGLELFAALGLSLAAATFLVGVSPEAAWAFVAALAALGVLVAARATPAHALLAFSALGLSATVDLVGQLQVGRTTAYAWLTGVVVAAAVVVTLLAPAQALSPATRRVLGYMSLLPAWALVSTLWAPVTLDGAQNALVYVAFTALAIVSALATASGALTFSALRRAMLVTLVVGSGLYAASLAADGVGGNAVVSARAYALFATVGVAWCVALARLGHRTELRVALLLSSLVFLSLSRTAFVASVVVLAIGSIGVRTGSDVLRSLAVVGCIGAVVVGIYALPNPFSARFSRGDVVTVNRGISFNVMGRAKLWRATWESALSHPILGGGVGSADAVVHRVSPSDDNPHNDYLRVFNDLGLIGLVVLALALGAPAASSAAAYRAARQGDRDGRSVHLAAVLMLIGLALGMTTDNALVYLFVLAPVAVVVGSSLGLRDRRPADRSWAQMVPADARRLRHQ